MEEHPGEELNATASSSNTNLLSPIKGEKQYNLDNSNNDSNGSNSNNNSDADNNENDTVNSGSLDNLSFGGGSGGGGGGTAGNASLNNGSERLSLQEMREKPLTLHNMKSASLASAKTEALIASLGLKPNSLELKSRLSKKTFLKKPLKKRLKGNFLYFFFLVVFTPWLTL